MGMVAINSLTVLDIMDSKETDLKGEKLKRPKMFHPVLGYTMYPESCEKFAKYYQEFL